jgi:hypothetical protein
MATKKSLPTILTFSIILTFIGCKVTGVAPSEHLDYRTMATLELPFNGDMFVVWGGRTLIENYHASLADQRFAIDLVQIVKGSTFKGNPAQNENYYCFGDTLFAPGGGQVVEMLNSVDENIPGETNKKQLFGNYVIIDHGNEEFSVLAHFMKNSIVVNVGEFVTQGQVIGLIGNSGNSTEPHLHYHLQNSPSIGRGRGLPIQFQNYYANDVFVPIGEPLRSQVIKRDK